MKIFIEVVDGTSMGIPSETITIDWPNLDQYTGSKCNQRDDIRARLVRFFQYELDNGDVGVRFEDECPECGETLKSGSGFYESLTYCDNQICIYNLFNLFNGDKTELDRVSCPKCTRSMRIVRTIPPNQAAADPTECYQLECGHFTI